MALNAPGRLAAVPFVGVSGSRGHVKAFQSSHDPCRGRSEGNQAKPRAMRNYQNSQQPTMRPNNVRPPPTTAPHNSSSNPSGSRPTLAIPGYPRITRTTPVSHQATPSYCRPPKAIPDNPKPPHTTTRHHNLPQATTATSR